MNIGNLLEIGSVVLALSPSAAAIAQEACVSVVRIAELEIDPAQLANYAVAHKDNATKLTFFETHADEAAYLAHRDSPHFRRYLAATKSMITARTLIETTPVLLSTK